MPSVLIHNIGLLATPMGDKALCGKAQGDISFTEDAWIAIEGEKILAVGSGIAPRCDEKIDAEERLVIPGLIDPHTHLVFGGWREHELSDKLRGIPYLEILKNGGGILSTVRDTRIATEEELTEKATDILLGMLKKGVTTCEAKSGYGLSLEAEIKQLNVLRKLCEIQEVELVSTLMAAHATPPEYKDDTQGYVDFIIDRIIPVVAEKELAKFIDVFCESGVFDSAQTEKLLKAGKEYGLLLKCHTDEINDIGGTSLAASLGAISCEHLIKCTDEGIEALSNNGTIGVLLPATSFYLGADFAPARKMIENNVPIAIGSDFNPGSCPMSSLPLAMQIGCYRYRMTPEEVLSAVTINAAAAIGMADKLGSIEPGKQADLVFLDADNLDYIFYRFGENFVSDVIKKGRTCHF
ncbi:MAG: imidazolonepropionase [Lachnospiraceae bacterium]|jgi:imidazolonepropionase|nr:imidazolonepropionase [Lachnospiraceae bacterium]